MNQPEQNLSEQTGNKEPWLAVNLSWLLPGIGQIYAGKYRKGWAILLGYYLVGAISIWFLIDPMGNVPIGIIALIFPLILAIVNLFDAHRTAKKANLSEFESSRKESKDAWLAVFLSGFIPGLGHIYLKQWLPAILFILTFSITFVGTGSAQAGIIVLCLILRFIIGLLAVYFAYTSTPVRRYVPRFWIRVLIAGFLGIVLVLNIIIAFVVRSFVAEARYIPAGSMLPTLAINDRVVINKLIYRFHPPERGDIVVFSPTETLKKEGYKDAFVKRIIGIPGDRVDVKDGKVYVNSKVISEKYLDEAPAYNWSTTELIPGGIIPKDSYLVFGDNRNNSYDSHYWGFVPREYIIGKATQRFWPIDRIGSISEK